MGEKSEWTVMFYFASDNPLAPMVVSELKAIKAAGFQEHTNVLVYFDPMEKGVPTKLYNINQNRKEFSLEHQNAKKNRPPRDIIGDGTDPYVHNLIEDEVDSAMILPKMDAGLRGRRVVSADESLRSFVEFGIKKFEANNYMLFLVGHGDAVGRDSFLPDDDTNSSISLKQLKKILKPFTEDGQTKLQLLCFHSCSMSSVEIAYQLRGRANYMIATQGKAFVNAWPFRQILKKTYLQVRSAKEKARNEALLDCLTKNGAADLAHDKHSNIHELVKKIADRDKDVKAPELEARMTKKVVEAVNGAHVDLQELVEKIYYLCLYNATDFMSAGYSADLVLCNLSREKVEYLKLPIQNLVRRLKKYLHPEVSLIKDLILLAHWESQSFFNENYTDLCDFCICLRDLCNERAKHFERDKTELLELANDCTEVINRLSVKNSEHRKERFEPLIIHADNFGSKYQYARGLSIYFPWCEPVEDQPAVFFPAHGEHNGHCKRSESAIASYRAYDFNDDFDKNSWWSFLQEYFQHTRRPPRFSDNWANEYRDDNFEPQDAVRLFTKAENIFHAGVELAPLGKVGPEMDPPGKISPEVGGGCDCPTIKNHPFDIQRRVRKFGITPRALRVFKAVAPEVVD